MDRDTFWAIIDEARETVDEVDKVASATTEKLAEYSPEEIAPFKQHQYDLLSESYRCDLWAVAYIVNGGCSDDGFDYFRGWLMANGHQRWETAMKTPKAVGDWAELDEADYEDMLYVAVDVYEVKTAENFPYDKLTPISQTKPAGDPWDEDELKTMHPKLWEKFF